MNSPTGTGPMFYFISRDSGAFFPLHSPAHALINVVRSHSSQGHTKPEYGLNLSQIM